MTPCEPGPGCCQAAKCQGGRPAKETVTKFCYCVLRGFLQPTKSCLELVKKTDQNGISITDLTQKRKKPLGVFSNKRNSPFTVTATTVAVVPETSLDNNKFVLKKTQMKICREMWLLQLYKCAMLPNTPWQLTCPLPKKTWSFNIFSPLQPSTKTSWWVEIPTHLKMQTSNWIMNRQGFGG